MVDTAEALESSFVSVDVVEQSPTKKLVVIDPGSYENDDFGNRKLSLMVNIDGKAKKWRPNKESVQNMQVLGKDTTDWIGKPISLTIEVRGGKRSVIARYIESDKPFVEPVDI